MPETAPIEPQGSSPSRPRRALSRKAKIAAGLAALAIEGGIVWVFVSGLAARWTTAPPPTRLTVTEIAPDPSPTPPPRPVERPAGAAAPAGVKARTDPVPEPRVVLASPVPAATASGSAAAGSGPGAGGIGTGSGAGGSGNGAGSGVSAPPQRIAGALSDRDYPRDADRAGGTVAIAFRVRADGGVDQCRVLASSGSDRLDALTCSLVERRFRYRPALGASGQPVDSVLRTSFTYGVR